MAVRGKTQHPANSLRRFAEHHAFLASVSCLLRVKTVSSKDFKAVAKSYNNEKWAHE
jgi:hypothetical protein